jgi:hypothetical protein
MNQTPLMLSKDEILSASKGENWEELWLIFIAHTAKRLRYRYGIKEKAMDLKIRARDHVSAVLHEILVEGSRKWNKDHYRRFEDFVISVIDSELYNTFTKKPSREVMVDELPDTLNQENAEGAIAYDEFKKEIFTMLEKAGVSDDELLVFECMADGIVKPAHIRSELGIDENSFMKIWRKLQRKLEKIRTILSNNE